ncbi:MAG: HlyD family efflux transporter periplasmic adaptor subunit [Candidatus Omnitrophica bacterium]|nr:HlyD family efflux transporter periplasmic adaptor subunit [Candidatus Omnitrophota bacterium]
MKSNRKKWIGMIIVVLTVVVWWAWGHAKHASRQNEQRIVSPHRGDIRKVVTTTGSLLPKNRLEIKPPVSGRLEQILVQEGDSVKAGQTIAWMSSTERAALLDAARGQGEESLKYWQEVYKPIPLIAPIDGEVIVGTIQPGQTLTTADPVVVLSDRLIVRAQVDETDIGRIQKGQKATISLDAYPDTRIDATVDHIYYESQVVNNVTIYKVDLLPSDVPVFFRSGMSANIEFVQESKENILVLPISAVQKKDGESFVLRRDSRGKVEKRDVEIGLEDDRNVEIVSGVTEDDEIVLRTQKYSPPKASSGGNPMMPQRRKR